MDALFGIPTAVIAAVLAGLTAMLAALTLALAVRNPVLVKLGVRHIPRRRARSALIVVGLALSTTIVAASFTTGDALGHTVRSLVNGSLGNVDLVVVAYSQGTRRFSQQDVEGLADGRIPVVAGSDFAASEVDAVRGWLADAPGVAGVAGALIRQPTITDLDQQTVSAGVNLLALPPDLPPTFGQLAQLDGTPAPLADLADGEVWLNEAGAAALLAQPGDRLTLSLDGRETPAQVRGVVANSALGGNVATAFASLAWRQAVEGAPGRINQIVIVAQGPDSLRYSAPLARRLRAELVNDRAAADLFRLLATPNVRAGLRESVGTQPDSVRPRILRLARALEGPGVTDEFKTLIGDPEVLGALRTVLFRLEPGTARQFATALGSLNRLTVVELKQLSLDIASRFASALTSTFLILGLFSIATGIMLVFLIFALLAAERRGELGMARALGTQRGHLVQIFLFEGALYDLAASLLGALVGLGVARLTLDLLGGYVAELGIRITPLVEPRSLVIAFCLGLLLTFGAVTFAAWRVARLNIVTAVRNLPDEPHDEPALGQLARQGRLIALVWALLRQGPVLVLLGLALALTTRPWPALMGLTALGWSLAMIGIGLAARWGLAQARVPRVTRDRVGFTLAGLALLVYWAQPAPQARVYQTERFVGGLELLALAGLLMILGAVWAVAYNLELLPALVGWVTTPLTRLSALAAGLRVASAYPARYRWRTGLAVLMFALVIFTVSVASILLAGTRYAYADLGVQAAGFDLRADVDPRRLPDLRAALPQAGAVNPALFAAVGGQASQTIEALQLDAPQARWQGTALQVVDTGWLDGVGVQLTHRAPGYATDRAVWDAVRDTPGLAVLHGSALLGRDVVRRGTDAFGGSVFTLQGVVREDRQFPATTVWARNPSGGPPLKLTVIGVLDGRASLGQGLYTTPATLSAAGWAPPSPRAYYLRLAPDVNARQAALGLTRSFSPQGLAATVLNEELRTAQGIRLLLNQLLQGFMGLGLVSGVVALGVIATRAVVERRQQIGVLRAIGFGRGMIHLAFLLEASLIAGLGILIGTALGLVVARNVVQFLALQNPEIQLNVPWDQLGLIALVAYGMTVLTTLLPTWQAGQVAPAEALRYE